MAGKSSGGSSGPNLKIAVIGAGAMGSGIAQVAAMAGNEVNVYDSYPNAVSRSRDSILDSLNKFAVKGKLSDQEVKATFGKIYFIDQLESIKDSDLVIEAIIEDVGEKKNIFEKIDSLVGDSTIIASNTSSFSITELAKTVRNSERFIGIHFFNPPVLMKLVEIIPALQTSDENIRKVTDLIESWGKITVQAKDTPGFIVNRIARPYYSEALRIAEEQLASPEQIDNAMKELGGFRMGPFELMDFIGNDINEVVTRSVWTAMHYEPRYKPSLLQENLVRAGWTGRKSGRGFYNYDSNNTVIKDEKSAASILNEKQICDRILTMLINEAADALYYGIATREDIDKAMTLGVNYPKGLLKWGDEIGVSTCVKNMDTLHDRYKEERYRCSIGLRMRAESQQSFYS